MIISAHKNDIEVSLDLLGTSGYKCDRTKVTYLCDNCGSECNTTYNALYRKGRLEKQYCRKCTIKLNDVVDKRKNTCLEKYGVDNPMKQKDIASKFASRVDYEKQRVNIKNIKQQFEAEGYKLLTKKYRNRTQNLLFICPEGHEGKISYSSWNRGSRCRVCAYDKQRFTIEFVRDELAKEGYTLLSKDYKNGMIPIEYKCPKGHTGRVRFHHWRVHNHRCSSCSRIESKAEIAIRELLAGYFSDIISNDRTIIKPYELDIVIPSKKIAVEYCGLYWHSEQSGKDKNYHLNKLNMCTEAGYKLITIFEDEWINKEEIVRSRLLHILGVSDAKTIHTRKCVIKEISPSDKNEFLEKYHIQGKDNSSIKLGLFYRDKIVSVMTFSKGSIAKGSQSKDGVYELNRFCCDPNYRVPGAADKIFKYFIKNYNFKSIFTYGDRRWSTGDLYKKLGFNFGGNTEVNYWYTLLNNPERFHRFNFRKSELNEKLDYFDSNFTEVENMINNGYTRIYDCGNTKWIYNK